MTEENKKPTTQNAYQLYQQYFEAQNKAWLTWWTQVLNTIWGVKK